MLNVFDDGEIQLTRGDTAWLRVNVTNDTGDDYEIQNGDTLTLSLKKRIKDVDVIMSKTVVGTDTFHIKPEDTTELSFGTYVYDVQLTTSGNDVYTVVPPSTFEILPEVTV